jgi:hypothetical protein
MRRMDHVLARNESAIASPNNDTSSVASGSKRILRGGRAASRAGVIGHRYTLWNFTIEREEIVPTVVKSRERFVKTDD